MLKKCRASVNFPVRMLHDEQNPPGGAHAQYRVSATAKAYSQSTRRWVICGAVSTGIIAIATAVNALALFDVFRQP